MFAWLVYVRDICHLWMLATSWECALFLDSQRKHHCLLCQTCHFPMMCLCLSSREMTCMWTGSIIWYVMWQGMWVMGMWSQWPVKHSVSVPFVQIFAK
jgi:hypothetical protein